MPQTFTQQIKSLSDEQYNKYIGSLTEDEAIEVNKILDEEAAQTPKEPKTNIGIIKEFGKTALEQAKESPSKVPGSLITNILNLANPLDWPHQAETIIRSPLHYPKDSVVPGVPPEPVLSKIGTALSEASKAAATPSVPIESIPVIGGAYKSFREKYATPELEMATGMIPGLATPFSGVRTVMKGIKGVKAAKEFATDLMRSPEKMAEKYAQKAAELGNTLKLNLDSSQWGVFTKNTHQIENMMKNPDPSSLHQLAKVAEDHIQATQDALGSTLGSMREVAALNPSPINMQKPFAEFLAAFDKYYDRKGHFLGSPEQEVVINKIKNQAIKSNGTLSSQDLMVLHNDIESEIGKSRLSNLERALSNTATPLRETDIALLNLDKNINNALDAVLPGMGEISGQYAELKSYKKFFDTKLKGSLAESFLANLTGENKYRVRSAFLDALDLAGKSQEMLQNAKNELVGGAMQSRGINTAPRAILKDIKETRDAMKGAVESAPIDPFTGNKKVPNMGPLKEKAKSLTNISKQLPPEAVRMSGRISQTIKKIDAIIPTFDDVNSQNFLRELQKNIIARKLSKVGQSDISLDQIDRAVNELVRARKAKGVAIAAPIAGMIGMAAGSSSGYGPIGTLLGLGQSGYIGGKVGQTIAGLGARKAAEKAISVDRLFEYIEKSKEFSNKTRDVAKSIREVGKAAPTLILDYLNLLPRSEYLNEAIIGRAINAIQLGAQYNKERE